MEDLKWQRKQWTAVRDNFLYLPLMFSLCFGTVALCLEPSNLGGWRLLTFYESGLGEKIKNTELHLERRREKAEVARGKKVWTRFWVWCLCFLNWESQGSSSESGSCPLQSSESSFERYCPRIKSLTRNQAWRTPLQYVCWSLNMGLIFFKFGRVDLYLANSTSLGLRTECSLGFLCLFRV